MDRRRRVCFLLLLVAPACAPAGEGAAPSVAALGEPRDGFPSWSERVVWVYANRARSDPAADLEACGDRCVERHCYPAQPPLGWSHELGRAARFQSDLLTRGSPGRIQHDTPCDVVEDIAAQYTPGPCAGDPSCACVGGVLGCAAACERFDARVRRFGGSPRAENIALAGGPLATFYAWLHEPYDVAACGRGLDSHGRPNGHRVNLLEAGPAVGIGQGGSVFTADFGFGDVPRGVVAGVHHPQVGPDVELHAHWYDPDGAAPSRTQVNVGGRCLPMTLERGTPDNGSWLAAGSGLTGCTRFFFQFEDASGTQSLFPGIGSFGIGCGEDWSAERPPFCDCTPRCEGCGGDDGCGGRCPACDAGTADAGADTGIVADASMPLDASTGRDGATGDAAGSRSGRRELVGGCCAAASGAAPAPWLLGVLLLATIGRRGR